MIRFFAVIGFLLMFVYIRQGGDLNKYINMKYSYLSTIAMVLFGIFTVIEFIRFSREANEAEKRKREKKEGAVSHDHDHEHDHHHDHHNHSHDHEHDHHHGHDHDDHAHESSVRWKRAVGRAILFIPIFTGILLPVQTFDSSFVKAKGFSFPQADGTTSDTVPGQVLSPDTSIFYSADDYAKVKSKEYEEFNSLQSVVLTDDNYLQGIEVIYDNPGSFMNRTVSLDGFIYRGEQSDANHYFVFRFGLIHCAADSGVFGMLVNFPDGTALGDDQWVKVTGTLTSEMYKPFEQVIPVLKVTEWEAVDEPSDPYVYRNF
ncbi:TIGR03943 family putative permease subunit [Cohnella fermenti]|uniref:TIGR03943 family protein n=1 Tax=Cohnella fermenti TaxID=2565925 RepID=A0A4S4BKM4_9BACL|nr:TIGR03943 family protein [Cohnella fermenti]THF72691.1 TIGR03943 family protein [Cohnella fermenti]